MSSLFSKNLRHLRLKKGLEQLELAQLLGRKSSSSVSEWEKGSYTPKTGLLSDMARIFNVSLHDLMNKDLTEEKPSNLIPVSPQSVPVPILGAIACGDPITAEENISGHRNESPDSLPSGNVYYVEAKGNSMEPTIPDGSHVLIREQPDVEYGQIAAVLVNDETEVTLKRVKKQGDLVMLVPDNSDHEPFIITKNNPAKILGRAVRFTQDL